MTDISTPEWSLTQLEQTVNDLLRRLDDLRKENIILRNQIQAQQLISDKLAEKNSRATQAIARVIASIEKEHHHEQ
jgi:Mg2+ and Co2+ transporter CorA